MNEWQLTNPELKAISGGCHLDDCYPGLACIRTPDGLIDCQHCPVGHYCGFIAAAGQRKLLEYLIAHAETGAFYIKNLMRDMLKEHEASQ